MKERSKKKMNVFICLLVYISEIHYECVYLFIVVVKGTKQGVESFSPEAVELLSAATKDHMRELLDKLSVVSEHRPQTYRVSRSQTTHAHTAAADIY